MSSSHIQKIAIVGGSGELGSVITDNLLGAKRFQLTAITRPSSKSSFPDAVKVVKGEYDSQEFLQDALKGQDILIIALGPGSPPEIQKNLINAAAKVELPWIFSNHWSSDGDNDKLVKEMGSILEEKDEMRKQIEELGKSNWLALANNQWIDYNLREGHFGIQIPTRTATFFDNGTTEINTTTIAQVGRAVAAILSLPLSTLTKDYKNNFIYIRSFSLTQREMLDAVQRVTKTSNDDWKIEFKPAEGHAQEGEKEGEDGMMKIVAGKTFQEGLGDRFYGKELANKRLGLPQEDLDEVIKGVLEKLEEKEKKEKEEDD